MASGVVRLEQRNNTLMEMGYYDDGPYEVKYITPEGLDDVAVPANSYLGVFITSHHKKHFLKSSFHHRFFFGFLDRHGSMLRYSVKFSLFAAGFCTCVYCILYVCGF